MTFGRLLLRNLAFHWRGNFAVFLGVAVGTAVLTGALLVGDSLRGSLRDRTLEQLGWVDRVLIGSRFFRTQLADELHAERIAPALMLQGSASVGREQTGQTVRQAGRVLILGVDDRFWPGTKPGGDDFWRSEDREVVLNRTLADELQVKAGDQVTIHLQKASAVPRETLLGRRGASDVLSRLVLKVRAVLPADSFGNQFSLIPSPASPRNAFVPLQLLQDQLELDDRVNALLVQGGGSDLQKDLHAHLTLADWGLTLQTPLERTEALFTKLDRNKDHDWWSRVRRLGKTHLTRAEWRDRIGKALASRADPETGALSRKTVRDAYRQRGYLSLESRQMLVEDTVADAALQAAKDTNLRAAPTLVYLANWIKEGNAAAPYSVVAALDPALAAPLGPFLPAGVTELKPGEIILVGWPHSPLPGKVGDTIELTYFNPEQEGKLEEKTAKFVLRGVMPLEGVADDPDITPEFPGITDKLTLRDWDPPFPYDSKRVQKRDEEYWNVYRTTPKAYISLADGQKLWGSRFGKVTSIRLAPARDTDLEKAADDFSTQLLQRLKPEQGGFVFDNVRQRGLEAGAGGTDFGELFLYFSGFLIIAALLLVGLLFRLNLDRRAAEIGLLLALGYRRGTVRRLLLGEAGVLAALGALVGVGGAVGYAWGLLELLRSWWPGTMDSSLLRLHAAPMSFVIGFGSAVIVSVLTIAWSVRALGKASPRALLAGETSPEVDPRVRRPRWSLWIAGGSLVVGPALIIAGKFVPGHEAQAGTFFGGGFLLLTAGLATTWALLRALDGRRATTGRLRVVTLALRNAGRQPVRSLLTAGLLASAAFLIVAVESFRRQPDRDFLSKHSGSGGFPLLAESDVPLYQDLNRGAGRDELNEALERARVSPKELEGVAFYPFRMRSGDDASCLNLYQPRRPRLLGVSQALIQRGGFEFADWSRSKGNAWHKLDAPEVDGAIPVFGEANTVQWMLKSKLGGIIEVPNDRGQPVKLRIVGLLQDSIFQGELLMSEANFLKLYPGHEGYNFFLIDAPPERAGSLKPLLETALADRGFEVTSTVQRLAAYLAVENTYLSTFQMLGGLGLVLGALGLAVVLLRSVWERRGEMALLRALGFRRSVLGRLVLVENIFLLAAGLGLGTVAALISVAPHVVGGGEVPWMRLVVLLLLVLFVGLAAGAAAMAATLRAPLLPALRRE
ncbi:MAG: FtsX-like permease family protein [Gemmataceae bacterium]|nr:FtsX-like permease family protein [Gemmataceae bacterium]